MNNSLISVGINIDMYDYINTVSKQCNISFENILKNLIEIGLNHHSHEELTKVQYISSRYNNIIVSCYIENNLIQTLEKLIIKNQEKNSISITKSKILNHCIHLTMTIPFVECIF